MNRSCFKNVCSLATVALLALPAIAIAQTPDTRPVIAVLHFDNSSYGPGAADFNGLEKGIAELLTTDLASNAKYRVVERSRIQSMLDEQNLVKSGAIDDNTAIRIGKLLGACQVIWGTFISGQGNLTITAASRSTETGQLSNPERITKKTDDVMGIIGDLSAKLAADMKITGCPTAAPRSGSAAPTQQGGNASATPATMAATVAATSPKPAAATSATPKPAATKPAAAAAPTTAPAAKSDTVLYRKELTAASLAKLNSTKLDMKNAMLYSKGLDAMDNKDPKKAAQLFHQVLAAVPGFQPAVESLKKVEPTGH